MTDIWGSQGEAVGAASEWQGHESEAGLLRSVPVFGHCHLEIGAKNELILC